MKFDIRNFMEPGQAMPVVMDRHNIQAIIW